MTLKSLMLFVLSATVLVTVTYYFTKTLERPSIQGISEKDQAVDAFSGTEDLPGVQFFKPDPIPKGETISSSYVTCLGEENKHDCKFEVGSEKYSLPNPSTLTEVKENDYIVYSQTVWIINNRIYIKAVGSSAAPGGGSSVLAVYEYDITSKTLKPVFSGGGNYKEMNEETSVRNLRPLVFLTIDDSLTATTIHRSFIADGTVHSSDVVSVPPATGWQLGADCRNVAPCFGWQSWVTILDEDNIVFRFVQDSTVKYHYFKLN